MKSRWAVGGGIAVALLVVAGCQVNTAVDEGAGDGQTADAGGDGALHEDAGNVEDAHTSDTGAHDTGHLDGGTLDAATFDAGEHDGGPVDAGLLDGGYVNTCGLGFCREIIYQGCGDPNYVPEISRACTTSDGKNGYCCEPAPVDQCAQYGGYCAFGAPCKVGYTSSQIQCGGGGPAGYCCIPEVTDGGPPLDAGQGPCSAGETKTYTCQDHTQVPWCDCKNGAWDCIKNPGTQCKIPCLDNCNCPPDRPICSNQGMGTCQARSSTACKGDSSMCACGETCVNDTCTPSQMLCTFTCDCPIMDIANFACVNGACVPNYDNTCNTVPCYCGTVCANVGPTTTCKAGCSDNCDCPLDAPLCIRGSSSEGACTPLPTGVYDCANGGHGCPCGQVCENHGCKDAPPRCRDNCDCHDNTNPICRNGVCGKSQGYPDCPCGLLCGT